jgi:two-component system phosphate regulon sensor histidine kinase PhoR
MDQLETAGDLVLLGRVLRALPEPVFAIDASDRILAINEAAQTLFPTLRLNDFLSRSLRAPDVLDLVAQVRAEGRAARATWLERVPVERQFEIDVAPLDGAAFGPALIVTLRDLTEARRLERMRVDFVANASHELRTPLASLLGFVETLQGPAREDPGARKRFLAIMRDQARRMARLVDDLLSLSRIEQNLHLRPASPVELSALARHIADTLTPLAQDSGVTIAVEAEAPVWVIGDRDELLRVIENLVENAIKYGAIEAAAPRVEIRVGADKAEGTLAVRDFGPGIAPEHLPRLTERFYRVDVGTSRAKGGTGLGLAIVKHIMARHRGRLSIASIPGQGASFTVALPLQSQAPQITAEAYRQ